MIARLLSACALLLCAACSGDRDAPSADQDREMNRAADLLDKAPDSLSNVDAGGLDQQIPGDAEIAADNGVTD